MFDRVSAFDSMLDSLIPFKGQILNRLSAWNFNRTRDIVPNAFLDIQPDPNVLVQKRVTPFLVEFIVRGYLWGSMAAGYEAKRRTFCGVAYPDGLMRYQKFAHPIVTPTSKGELGEKDEEMTMEEVELLIGKEATKTATEYALALFERGTTLALNGKMIFIDTKYEFGVDENGKIYVIDEVNTPDSSRLCDVSEYTEKYDEIKKLYATGQFSTVSALLKAYPALKIKEYSKQYVRDLLIEQGYTGGSPPSLTKEQKEVLPRFDDCYFTIIYALASSLWNLSNPWKLAAISLVIECCLRYIQVYERITQELWTFPSRDVLPQQRLVSNLIKHGNIKGCCTVILGGSNSDASHLENIKEKINNFGIPSAIRICSAHKQPQKLARLVDYYNRSITPLLFVCCAGGTDALSGTVSYLSMFPAVTSPPDGLNQTCLSNPPGSSNAFILKADNVAKFALQMFSHLREDYRSTLKSSIKAKIDSLEKADVYV
ncbi:putative Phosphoribosylaminoimidazole-succinocarboxamide [Cardiosporidium cionae]|uniref:SAICAR synthetase n=1 Tax=Cardiosporidium cionae TaxID=476202 RepID=A0ABQ7JBJ9_9APIC|nr:putative Phosphoribosylaminoimidazole-succinocarboxamide [Cardiosporidium cionae]|eukprot:KAF8821035.1 putative Phosphoribosylaminoimidazole-succinocarboxamide [Cardiosporidium cionae]